MRNKHFLLVLMLLLAAGLKAQTLEEVRGGLEHGLKSGRIEGETVHIVYGDMLKDLVPQLPVQWEGHRLAYYSTRKLAKLCRRGILSPHYLYATQRGGDTLDVSFAQWHISKHRSKIGIMVEAEGPFVRSYTDSTGRRVMKTESVLYRESWLRFEQLVRTKLVERFYDRYLSFACGSKEHDWDSALALMTEFYSDSLMAAYLRSGEPETDRFVDYDMLIQGQDCWPTICVESVEPVGETYWMRVTLLVPASSDNGMEEDWRRCVYCYIDQIQGMYRIACIRDQYNQLGEAAEALAIEN